MCKQDVSENKTVVKLLTNGMCVLYIININTEKFSMILQ